MRRNQQQVDSSKPKITFEPTLEEFSRQSCCERQQNDCLGPRIQIELPAAWGRGRIQNVLYIESKEAKQARSSNELIVIE
jgi:hypothetical protein